MDEPLLIDHHSPAPDRRAFNAYRHGLTGHVLVVEPEDQQAYREHCTGVLANLAPSGALESSLAQTVADDLWRLHRAAAIENNILARGLTVPADIVAHQPQVDSALATARTFEERDRVLDRLTLYENRLQRKMERNLALLERMQAERRAALEQAAEEANLLAQLAREKGESFDPERDLPSQLTPAKFVFSAAEITSHARRRARLAEAKARFSPPAKVLKRAA